MKCRAPLILLFLSILTAADAQVPAPQWHTGQQWRVQAPQQVGRFFDHGGDVEITDSKTDFTSYRFTVLGRRTLRFEEQDGRYHVGQAVPPENCWLVNVAPEGSPAAEPPYHCYFRVSDLSLRGIYQAGTKGRGGYFICTRTVLNDTDDARPVVETIREPFRAPIGPLVLDWPCFPLTARNAKQAGQISQSVAPEGAGVRVVLRDGTESTTQVWMPGDPWWRRAERDGKQKSRLFGTPNTPFVQQQGKLGL